ncbi:hypothetical protein C8R44DRAFT_725229 [Mycena epipterygia]|nr:hypothetical protein C8R44DRAFT_725229 [Mycena epipterygia]
MHENSSYNERDKLRAHFPSPYVSLFSLTEFGTPVQRVDYLNGQSIIRQGTHFFRLNTFVALIVLVELPPVQLPTLPLKRRQCPSRWGPVTESGHYGISHRTSNNCRGTTPPAHPRLAIQKQILCAFNRDHCTSRAAVVCSINASAEPSLDVNSRSPNDETEHRLTSDRNRRASAVP